VSDIRHQIVDAVCSAHGRREALSIVGGGTKHFVGRKTNGRRLDVSEHSGVVDYAPGELVMIARGGTRIGEIEEILAREEQMLGFEPPHFANMATIAGTLASNLSGPRRPWCGSVRDGVLGVRLVNGRGEALRFGGQVMKNVAGFDVSRLQAGALGAFGIITEVSLRVLPRPEAARTLVHEVSVRDVVARMASFAAAPKPLTGAAWVDGALYLRLEGTEAAVAGTARQWGGAAYADGETFWRALREHRLAFFDDDRPLWRFSIRPTAPLAPIRGPWLLDWAGAQRFVFGDFDRTRLEAIAEDAGGHVSLFRGGNREGEVAHTLPGPMVELHKRLKSAFDPERILNPGRLYAWL
jgi:glycolate oxidase FAD binding subunit